jgi:hypothetical protein
MAGDAFMSAIICVLSAKTKESLMFVRKAVEAIAIAGVIVADPPSMELWVNRKKCVRRYRRRFSRSRLFPVKSRIRGQLLHFYDFGSDVGTHANPEGLVGRRTTAAIDATTRARVRACRSQSCPSPSSK